MTEAPRQKRPYVRRQNPVREAEVRTEPVREPVREVKRRIRASNAPLLDVPSELIPPGMDLLWVTDSVNGKPEPQIRASYEINHWEPVLGKDHPEIAALFMPKGWQGEINVGGLVLEQRPLEVTMEARQEERIEAQHQLGATVNKLRTGQLDGVTLDTQHPTARANTKLTREMVRGMPVTKD